MVNIVVINPPNKPFTNQSILAEPLDVLLISTIIDNYFGNVKVIDMDLERLDNNINDYLTSKNIVVFVYDYQLPLHTSDTVNNIKEIINNTKKDTKFIMIGKYSSYNSKLFIEMGIDVVIKGIAENIIIDVIENIDNLERLNKIPNIIYRNGIVSEDISVCHDYSKLPMIRRDFIEIAKYMDTRTLISSRGCNGVCKFCTTPYFFKQWSGKSPNDVVEEIEMLINKYHTKKIIFLDDNAIVDKKRMLEICYLIKKKKIKCLFGCLGSIKCYDKELLREMYQVGFRWIHFGLESGSKKMLHLMNKEMDINRVKEIISEVKEMGYRVRASFILDYPLTTKEDIELTKEFILDINVHELRLHYLAYRVGTPVFNENKNIENKTQYIHSNKPNIENKELTKGINSLLEELKNKGYEIVTDEIDWKKYNNLNKEFKVVAFTPIKYGMCWYE